MKRFALLALFALSLSAQTVTPPPAPPPRPKIAGSMVGYVDDPIVGSQVRIRFEAGFHNDVPDRAEFFYAKCGCYKFIVDPKAASAIDNNAPGPGPGAANNIRFQQLYLQTEYAPGGRFSVFAELPFRWLQPQSFYPGDTGFTENGAPRGRPLENPSGLGDLRAGVKVALAESSDRALTLQVRAYFPTANEQHGLGTGHYSIEPSLLYYRKLTERTTIEAQVGDWHPTGGSAGIPTIGSNKFSGDVVFYGAGVSHEVYAGARMRIAPVAELFGWHVVSGFQTGPANPDAGGTDIVNLKVGARLILDEHNSFYGGIGRALTGAVWYRSIARIEYRYSY
jgi:hypothetical protein